MHQLTKLSLVLTLGAITSCGGNGNNPSGNLIDASSCAYTSGDNLQNPDGSTNFVTRSHTVGSPVYRAVVTRKKADGSDVVMDYMLHEPVGTPTGIFVLIAGGKLNAGIEYGTNQDGIAGDGSPATRSRGNFLVRTAHHYMNAGFRVITIDRPDDYSDYFSPADPSSNYDTYRNSMKHAVDLATVINRDNTDNLPVIISGTSRGAISAAANNTLATLLALSSPVTSGSGGTPVGSAGLPLSSIKRPSHVLLHANDTCSVTLASDTRSLANNLDDTGLEVAADEVSGGFRDTVRNDTCGAFDYHGFNGIGTCAAGKAADWADNALTGAVLGTANTIPVADDQTVTSGDPITLTASDTDGDVLSFSLPYSTSSLGGDISVNASTGAVTYTAPIGVNSTEDSFAFVVEDGNGGVGRAVVRITIP